MTDQHTPLTDHRPEPWFWEADSEHCPHGPEPEDDTTEAWDTWHDRHQWAPQDVRICLDAPIGDACPECSAENGEFVPWADCTVRPHQRRKDTAMTNSPTAHEPITVLVGTLECLDRECDEYFTADGDDDPGVERCSHIREETVCAGCSTERSEEFWDPTVAWTDCPERPAASAVSGAADSRPA